MSQSQGQNREIMLEGSIIRLALMAAVHPHSDDEIVVHVPGWGNTSELAERGSRIFPVELTIDGEYFSIYVWVVFFETHRTLRVIWKIPGSAANRSLAYGYMKDEINLSHWGDRERFVEAMRLDSPGKTIS